MSFINNSFGFAYLPPLPFLYDKDNSAKSSLTKDSGSTQQSKSSAKSSALNFRVVSNTRSHPDSVEELKNEKKLLEEKGVELQHKLDEAQAYLKNEHRESYRIPGTSTVSDDNVKGLLKELQGVRWPSNWNETDKKNFIPNMMVVAQKEINKYIKENTKSKEYPNGWDMSLTPDGIKAMAEKLVEKLAHDNPGCGQWSNWNKSQSFEYEVEKFASDNFGKQHDEYFEDSTQIYARAQDAISKTRETIDSINIEICANREKLDEVSSRIYNLEKGSITRSRPTLPDAEDASVAKYAKEYNVSADTLRAIVAKIHQNTGKVVPDEEIEELAKDMQQAQAEGKNLGTSDHLGAESLKLIEEFSASPTPPAPTEGLFQKEQAAIKKYADELGVNKKLLNTMVSINDKLSGTHISDEKIKEFAETLLPKR